MTTQDQHPDAETIDACALGGSTPDERAAVDAHAANCAQCRDALASAVAADESIGGRLRSAAVDAGFDDRLAAAFRTELAPRWRIHPAARRSAVAAAAVLVIGGIGYGFANGWPSGREQYSAKLDTNNKQADLSSHGAATRRPEIDTDGIAGDLLGDATGLKGGRDKSISHEEITALDRFRNKLPPRKPAMTPPFADTAVAMPSTPPPPPVETPPAGTPRVLDDKGEEVSKQANTQFAYDGDHTPTFFRVTDVPAATPPTDFGIGATGLGMMKLRQSSTGLAASGGARPVGVDPTKADNAPNIVDAVTTASADPEAQRLALADDAKPAMELVPTTTQPAVDTRKIIRTGTMEFEVDRFDSAMSTLTKVVLEAGGFVGNTDSQKLPNGKMRGTITLRVAPERLDGLVANLRALGDLKSQQISAQDVTKEYTDTQSELSADRAMQDRLLDLIKSGKGSIKDLLAAENELGVWRTKIEKAEGLIRYYNSQVSLSTLSVTLSERDIQTPATAYETETADMGVETDDVEKARADALKIVDDVKGRVVEAGLKRLDAGQLAARIVAEIPADGAGGAIDRLKQLGRVARLDVQRQTTATDGSTTNAPVRTERRPTRVIVSIYNLANVAARRVTTIKLAADDVEAAYKAAVTAAKDGGGRVVASNLDKADPVAATGTVTFEVQPIKFEAAVGTLRSQGEILKLTAVENPDTANTTDAKQGVTVTIVSLASVHAREAVQQSVAAVDVRSAYQSVLSVAGKARVISARLNEQDPHNVSADIELEVQRSQLPALDAAIGAAAETVSRTSNRSAEVDGSTDSKIGLQLSITPADRLAARETTALQVEVADVDKAAADAQAMAVASKGRVVEATTQKEGKNLVSKVSMDVPLTAGSDVVRQLRSFGAVRAVDSSRDAQAPTGNLAHAVVRVEFVTGDSIVAESSGPLASIKRGLSWSVLGLLWSLQWIVVGLCLVLPWAALLWIGRKLWRRTRVVPAAK